MRTAAADTRRINENKLPSVSPVGNVDRVTRGSRKFAHDCAPAPQDGIDERRFSDVRAADDRDA